MKTCFVALTLLFSFASFGAERCTSEKELLKQVKGTKILAAFGFRNKSCQNLVNMLESRLCESVQDKTVQFAEKTARNLCK